MFEQCVVNLSLNPTYFNISIPAGGRKKTSGVNIAEFAPVTNASLTGGSKHALYFEECNMG